jgi:hypothetical protein
VNVIGITQKPSGDGTGVPGSYGGVLSTQALPISTNLAGYETTLGGSSSYGIGQTYAEIMAGTLGVSSTGIIEKWRSRAATELPGANPPGNLSLDSDVVNLGGISAGTANTFTLQMSYDTNAVGGEAAAASNGFIFVGWRNPGSGIWTNAVNNNVGGLGSLVATGSDQNYQGSWASFVAATGVTPSTLANFLGSWGVDTVNHDAWAIIDYSGGANGAEFAVVPEPGTLALLAAGVFSLGVAYRRRKAGTARRGRQGADVASQANRHAA